MAYSAESKRQDQKPSRPLKVNIVGAGIAGLTLGIILRRNGHEVEIYEQSRFARELGAAVHMGPNAHGPFKALKIDLAATGANEVQLIREYAPSGDVVREIPASKVNSIWQHTWMLAHRVRVHDALNEAALDPDGQGKPCVLNLATAVESVDPETATIVFKDGSTVSSDVVVGADGVHSSARQSVPGGSDAKLFGSGKSGFRFMIHREDTVNDMRTRALCDQEGVFSVVIGSDRRIVMYPTSNNTLLNVLAIHPESETDASEGWSTPASVDSLRKVYKGFGPQFQALLSKADAGSLKLWKLCDMESLPAWNHCHLALIGDAAHPFLPHQGQGAAMAMEDAVALGTVLERGLAKSEIPARLELYNVIRYKRACKVQQYTRLAGLDVQEGKLDTIEYAKYNFGHDEFHNSAQRLREWKWRRLPKAAFQTLPAFGPDPETIPRLEKVPFQSTEVRFVTSRTLVQNLFPAGVVGFTFDTPGSRSICSFVQTSISSAKDFATGNYYTLALHLHDVSWTAPGGKPVSGVYVPVVFGDSVHNVVRDRERLGLPAIYGDIHVESETSTHVVTASIDGFEWVKIVLDELQSRSPSDARSGTPGASPKLLTWRSVADCGGKRDDYAIQISDGITERQLEVRESWTSKNATIKLEMAGGNAPSNFSHVIARLVEIPIYEILSAEVSEGMCAPWSTSVHRMS